MNQPRFKILFLSNIPSPYRVAFFNSLSRYCDLTVLYQLHASSERDERWTAQAEPSFRQVFLPGRQTDVDKAFCPGVLSWLRGSWDAILIHGNSSPTELLAIAWCKTRGIPYILEGDGAFVGEGAGLKERVKRFAIRGAARYFSTCRELDNYYLHYGAEPDKLRRYRFSSLTEADILPRCPTRSEKKALRRKLGIREGKVVLSIGQFIPRKGIDLLLEAVKTLAPDLGVYIIGGTPTEDYLRFVREHGLDHVHFVAFQPKEALRDYYMAADLFVLPTREDIWGLVVNEAMACGLGVVTTNRCNAGLELIRQGENGFLVPVGEVPALAEAIREGLNQSEALGKKALETIRPITVTSMAQDHIRLVEELREASQAGR